MTTGTSLPYLACMSNFTTRGASKHRRQPMFRVIVAVLLLATTTVVFGLFNPGTAHAAVATISGPARVYTSSDVGAIHVPGAPFDLHFTGTDPISNVDDTIEISGTDSSACDHSITSGNSGTHYASTKCDVLKLQLQGALHGKMTLGISSVINPSDNGAQAVATGGATGVHGRPALRRRIGMTVTGKGWRHALRQPTVAGTGVRPSLRPRGRAPTG